MTKNSPKIVIKGLPKVYQIVGYSSTDGPIQALSGGHYWYTLESPNGQTHAQSEMYTRKHDAKRAALKLATKFGMTKFQLVDETAKKKK